MTKSDATIATPEGTPGMNTIVKHAESHLDHNLSEAQLAFVLSQTPTGEGVQILTVDMPAELGTLECAIYGPSMGDKPVAESDVTYAVRGDRKGESRLVDLPARQSSKVTIVTGPHDGHDWVLFTSYGGPAAPREVFEDDSPDTVKFWSEHALAQ